MQCVCQIQFSVFERQRRVFTESGEQQIDGVGKLSLFSGGGNSAGVAFSSLQLQQVVAAGWCVLRTIATDFDGNVVCAAD
jgi:hypothetical protein